MALCHATLCAAREVAPTASAFCENLNGLFGEIEFRETEAGRKALLHGLTVAAEWMLRAGMAALAG